MSRKRKHPRPAPPKGADEFWETPNMKRWAQHVIEDLVPKVESSHAVISLWTGKADVKLMVETGAAIMLDKPIVVVAFNNEQIPAKLRAVADEVVIAPDGVNEKATRDLTEAFDRVRKT